MFKKFILWYLRNFPVDFGKHRIAKLLTLPNQNEPVKYLNGDQMVFDLDLNEYQMKQIFLFDRYEKNSVRHLLHYLNKIKKNNITILDVGANIGFYTMYLSRFGEKLNAKVHSFEPNPVTFDALESHAEQNNLKNCVLNPFGLSDKAQEIEISYNPKNLGAASVFGNSGRNKAKVKLRTLDDYCNENNISEIDIIKVDIEGSELNFLEGGKSVINRSKHLLVVMEIVDENCIIAGYDANYLFNYMTERGFKAFAPKSWPFGLKQIKSLPENFHDNIFFIKS